MTQTENTDCVIRQAACGLIAGEPLCPKCGLDTRVGGYTSKEAGMLARATAEAQYWKNHAKELETQIHSPAAPTKPAPSAALGESRAVGQIFQDLPTAPQMVVLPSGSFLMGSADDDVFARATQRPQHKVTIAHKLAIGRYPVTFEEWDACLADGGASAYRPDDETWGRGKRPVINVDWDDAQSYVKWLNEKLGIASNDPTRYRLPSEAEWEYACRAGTNGHFSTASGLLSDTDATYDASYVLEGLSPKPGKKHEMTTPVGIYAPNPWGLYDMHGNVFEWVQDHYEDNYRGAAADGTAWETGAVERVLRGGSWYDYARVTRAANRGSNSPDYRDSLIGFRLARTVP